MPRALLLLLTIAVACSDTRETPADSTRAERATSPADSSAAADAADSGTIVIDHAVERDLTGDGRPERIAVAARGPDYDSLDVRLTIADAAGRELYAHEWNSILYFVYTDSAQRSDDADRRQTERQLARLIADSAFRPLGSVDATGRRTEVDTNAVRYHLAEIALQEKNGGRRVPGVGQEDAARVADSLVARVADDVRGKPAYTYFSGGEATYSIRWSERLQRFVRVFACC